MSEHQTQSLDAIIIHPQYQTAHAQITEPTRFVAMSHYYRRRWLRVVGPVGTAILLELRGRCYNNPATGERRDTVVAGQKELAEAIGISVDTLQRQLGRPGRDDDPKANQDLRRFVWTEERYERSEAGRVRQLENVYHVSMDDPVHPDDEGRLRELVEESERQARDTAGRQQGRRKVILPAQHGHRPETSPEPHSAVLRFDDPNSGTPLPQIAVTPCRNLRQGSPQIAALSEESLLPITGVFTKSTFNVGEAGSKASPWERRQADLADEAVALTGDEKSRKRYRQLAGIALEAGAEELWRTARRATELRLTKSREPLDAPGAYFCGILTRLLADAGVYVPVGSKAERADVQAQIALSLAQAADPVARPSPLEDTHAR